MTSIELESYVTGWENAYLARFLIAGFGIAIAVAIFKSFFNRGYNLLFVILASLVSAACLIFALLPQQVIGLVISTPYLTRIRIIAGGISLIVLFITLESIRRNSLQERYAILWIATALVIFLCAVLPAMVALFRALTGMNYVGVIVAVAFTFLILVAFHFSISLSETQKKLTKITQKLALLEMRLKKISEKNDKDVFEENDDPVEPRS